MFNIGDHVIAIQASNDGRIEIGTEYIVKEILEGNIKVKEFPYFYRSSRFELTQTKQPLPGYSNGRYCLEKIDSLLNWTVQQRAQLLLMYKMRTLAAQIHTFDERPGQRIQTCRSNIRSFGQIPLLKLSCPKFAVSEIYDPKEPGARKQALLNIRASIKEVRANRREISHNTNYVGFCRYCVVHHNPNEILNYFYSTALEKPKTPTTKEQHVGIEIECFVPQRMPMTPLVPLASFISTVNDGSIVPPSSKYKSIEIRVLATVNNFEERLNQTCAALAEMKAAVNKTCGLHIHLDMRDRERDQVEKQFNNLVRSQKFLFKMVDPARRSSKYCLMTRAGNPFQARHRYRAINACALQRHNTLEIRLHEGTTDALVISNWIKILHKICEAPPMLRTRANMLTFSQTIGLPPVLRTYMEQRTTAQLAPMEVSNV